MSLRLGNNIDREGKCLPSKVVANGAKYVRIVGSLDFDQRPLLVFYRTSGRIIIMTLAKESFSKGGNLLPYDTASAELGKMYRDYVDIVQIGNEADHDDPNASSSWTMAPAEWNVLKAMVMRAFGAGVKYIAFGAASGNVDKLKGYDFSGLAGIAVHPYGQRAKPDLNIPFWGGHGDVVPLMYRYFAATGLPIYVTEIGIQVPGDAHTHADARTYLAWLIGDGIHERMEKEKDVPRSHEMYTHHPIDGRTLFSVVEGKRNRYRWTPSDGVKVSGSYYN
jgi:hypothetical protein